MAKSYLITIGNSDDKLTQKEWSNFVWSVIQMLEDYSETIHFEGYALPHAKWQNASWVFTGNPTGMTDFEWIDEITSELKQMCVVYKQDSIIFSEFEPQFISNKD